MNLTIRDLEELSPETKKEFEEYDDGYEQGKQYANEQLKLIHEKLASKPAFFIDGYWDAISDSMYFV